MAVEKSDGDDIDGSSWNKISNKALIVGYKEGVDNAKDQVLQEGFDVGYVRGLDIGLRLGFYNALSRYFISDGWAVCENIPCIENGILYEMHQDNFVDPNVCELLKMKVQTPTRHNVPLENQLKASLSPEMFDKLNDENTTCVLKKPSMGHCQMCADTKILEYPMANAFQIQDQCNDTIKEKLDDHFLEICTHLGIRDNIKKI